MKKYKIKLKFEKDNLPPGLEVVDKCCDDYHCYYSYKDKTFFIEEQNSRDKSKKTIKIANSIIKFVNMKDELYKIASLLDKHLPRGMLSHLFEKCPFIKFDDSNPLYYMHFDEHYVGGRKCTNFKKIAEREEREKREKEKQEQASGRSSNSPSPRGRNSSTGYAS